MFARIFKFHAIFKFSLERKSSASVVQYPRHILLICFGLICTRGIRVRSNKPNPSPKSNQHTPKWDSSLLHSPFSTIPLPLTRHNPQPTDSDELQRAPLFKLTAHPLASGLTPSSPFLADSGEPHPTSKATTSSWPPTSTASTSLSRHHQILHLSALGRCCHFQ